MSALSVVGGSMTDGGAHERYFARFFDQAGYFVQRAGASGAGNFAGDAPGPTDDRAQPDVLAAGDGDLFAFEVKSGDPPHYWREDEVAALKWVARQASGRALGVSRFPRDSYRVWSLGDLHETDAGSRRAKPDDDPLVVLQDPRSEADEPPGLSPADVADRSLAHYLLAESTDD